MNDESWVEQSAEFIVRARDFDDDFDPALITRTLGIEPTRTFRAGVIADDGEPTNFSSWIWTVPRRVEFRCQAVLSEVLAVFEPVAEDLALARSRHDLDYTVSLRIDMHGFVATSSEGKPDFLTATPAVIFDADVLARLAALGCRLHLEQNIYSDANELQPEQADQVAPDVSH